ncbi:MAG: hypothetical protein SFX74_13410 [Fimbriimonadaceae bacterium]|nr:hypothetical protein [Fimbriimonadaceae bacterium]
MPGLVSLLALLAPVAPSSTVAPVALVRKFVVGQRETYAIRSNLHSESRSGELRTWIPEDIDINYDFTIDIRKQKADGIAEVLYRRPTMVIQEGETFEGPGKRSVEKVNFDLTMDVSPINELLKVTENPKPKAKGSWRTVYVGGGRTVQLNFGQFISEIQRLALFVGPIDSSLDFNPKLPLDVVSVGDTWKKTVGFQPQKLRGTANKQAVQRLDCTYTYRGLQTINKKSFQRIDAEISFSNDLGEFLRQMLEDAPEGEFDLKLPVNLRAKIEYFLDPKTMRTLRAVAESEGGFSIMVTSEPDPVQEQKFRGRTTMSLVSVTAPKPAKK